MHLDTLLVGSKDESNLRHRIVAVHEDGTVTTYLENLESSDLNVGLKKDPSAQESPRSASVEFAIVLSTEQARKTILKNREDLLATVERGFDDVDGSLLLLVSRSQQPINGRESLRLRILTLHVTNADTNAVFITGTYVRELASLIIPEPNHVRHEADIFTFHASSGTLYQLGRNVMVIYDLTRSTPQITHELALGSTLTSCLQISPGILAYCCSQTLSIVNSTYQSLQDSFSFSGESGVSVNSKTSKMLDIRKPNEADARLLSYFAPLGLLIVLRGRKILAIDLSTTTLQDGQNMKRKRDTSLSASLGKGYSSATKESPALDTLERQIKSLGKYLPPNTAIDGPDSVSAGTGPELPPLDPEQLQKAALESLVSKPVARHKSKGNSIIDKGKIYQLLNRMFIVEEIDRLASSGNDPLRKLRVSFLRSETCNSLIKLSFLTAHHVEMAMKHHGVMPFTSRLVCGALVQALAEWDPSLNILLSVVASPLPLSSEELVHVLAIVTRDTQDSESMDIARLLTNGGLDDASDGNVDNMQLTNRDVSHDPASLGIHHGPLDHRLLNLTLKRLYAIPSPSVARALQTELSTSQVRVLVDTLRLEIARSGWLSPYNEHLESTDQEFQDNNQICYIAHLLNCAIDTVGTGGWILGSSMSEESTQTADTISYMKAEISAALEGIEEATYLKGMLGEILLCAKNSSQSPAKTSNTEQPHLSSLVVKPLTIALDGKESGVLPLGLKPAPTFSKTRVGAGGELKRRSARDIGRLKSKAVGKYSFDRILV